MRRISSHGLRHRASVRRRAVTCTGTSVWTRSRGHCVRGCTTSGVTPRRRGWGWPDRCSSPRTEVRHEKWSLWITIHRQWIKWLFFRNSVYLKNCSSREIHMEKRLTRFHMFLIYRSKFNSMHLSKFYAKYNAKFMQCFFYMKYTHVFIQISYSTKINK